MQSDSTTSAVSDTQVCLPWTSSAAASRARESAPQASGSGSRTNEADSGRSTRASSRSSARGSSSSKTLRASLRAGWTSLSVTSSGRVIASKGGSSQRATSARRTGASVSSCWPTPVTTDAKGARRSTARTVAWTSNTGTTLLDAVVESARLWPTPSACSYGTSNNGNPGDARTEYRTKGKPSLFTIAQREGAALNPEWVDVLMGFPMNWTRASTQMSLPIDGPPNADSRSIRGNRDARAAPSSIASSD